MLKVFLGHGCCVLEQTNISDVFEIVSSVDDKHSNKVKL